MRVQHAMPAPCEVKGESPGRVDFEARESVRVRLALDFADVAQPIELKFPLAVVG